jgi:hypothetical protein
LYGEEAEEGGGGKKMGSPSNSSVLIPETAMRPMAMDQAWARINFVFINKLVYIIIIPSKKIYNYKKTN